MLVPPLLSTPHTAVHKLSHGRRRARESDRATPTSASRAMSSPVGGRAAGLPGDREWGVTAFQWAPGDVRELSAVRCPHRGCAQKRFANSGPNGMLLAVATNDRLSVPRAEKSVRPTSTCVGKAIKRTATPELVCGGRAGACSLGERLAFLNASHSSSFSPAAAAALHARGTVPGSVARLCGLSSCGCHTRRSCEQWWL